VDRSGVEDRRLPDNQLEDSVNPMSGDVKRREIERNHFIFSESEVQGLVESLRSEGQSAKFAYKRGTFYVVDAFGRADDSAPADLNGISVTPGDVGRGFKEAGETLHPEKYSKSVICSKGGYSSTDAQLARREDRRAVFSFNGDISSTEEKEDEREENSVDSSGVTAVKVVELGHGMRLEPPYDCSYAVTNRKVETRSFSEASYVSDSRDVLTFDSDELVLDTRKMSSTVVSRSFEVLEADFKAAILGSGEEVRQAVRRGYDLVVADRGETEDIRREVLRQEKKLLLENAREKL